MTPVNSTAVQRVAGVRARMKADERQNTSISDATRQAKGGVFGAGRLVGSRPSLRPERNTFGPAIQRVIDNSR